MLISSINQHADSEKLLSLCEEIDMPSEVSVMLAENFKAFDFSPVLDAFNGLFSIETGKEASGFINEYCNRAQDGLLALTVYLTAALLTRENYKKLGIDGKIYIDTIKIFTRFVNEHLKSYGKYGFDRGWWIYRNLSCSLFRLGELEFEMCALNDDEGGVSKKGDKIISVHIPSDARLLRNEIDSSYMAAGEFFKKFFGGFSYKHTCCHSWLLSPVLKELLPETSKIIGFQNDYEIVDYDGEDKSFMEWVYKKEYEDYNELTENTSLERNIKKHLLNGGTIGVAFGILKTT